MKKNIHHIMPQENLLEKHILPKKGKAPPWPDDELSPAQDLADVQVIFRKNEPFLAILEIDGVAYTFQRLIDFDPQPKGNLTMTSKFKIVGSRFRPPAPTILACLNHHQLLELRLEPDNPYDPNAVAVWITDFASDYPEEAMELEFELGEDGKECPDLTAPIRLGYIPREQAAELAPAIAALDQPPPARYISVEGGPGVELGSWMQHVQDEFHAVWQEETKTKAQIEAEAPVEDEIPF